MLRAGPPEGRGRRLDLILGAVGILLVVLAAVLVQALPEEDIVVPHFRVVAVDTPHDVASQGFDFSEAEGGRLHEFAYDIPIDNVHFIVMDMSFRDDVVSSLPDQFSVELIDPAGQPVGTRRLIENEQPTAIDPQRQVLGYNASFADARISFTVADRPDENVEDGEPGETAEEVRMAAEAKHHAATAGTWRVRVTLLDAGDCPGPDWPDQQRILACEAETGHQEDTGNHFDVELFQYTSFAIAVEEL